MSSPATYYQQQKELYTLQLNEVTRKSNRVAMMRLWLALAAIAAFIWAFRSTGSWHWWVVAVAGAAFLALVRYHQHLGEQQALLQLHITIINNELQALEGNNSAFADGGKYTDTAHPYSYDLDIFGKGSVYQMLCRAATGGGAALLAARLSALTMSKQEILERQAVVSELGTMPHLQQDFRVAGAVEKEEPGDQARLEQWLQGEDHFINRGIIRAAVIVMPLLSILGVIYSIYIGGMFAGLTVMVIINWVFLGINQKTIKPAIAQVGTCGNFLDKFERLLQQVAAQEYKGAWLQTAGKEAKASLESIAKFKNLVGLLESRENVMVGPTFNSLFIFDIVCLVRLELWRKTHKAALLAAIDAVINLDVYVSCAVYAFNHPDNIYPGINDTGCSMQAKDLRHPLLSPKSAVGNNVDIGGKEQFYLLTGANMTGKSTFIRTIGVSNVLCNMGLPLPAAELSMPLLDLYTSMRITDSVQDDVSYFRAELNRIKTIMDKVRVTTQPYLVLLDEPLRGTNSTDKQQGTRSIVETLLTFHAIGIVATHDTGLCDMATNYPGKVSNYHFESKVEANGLSFDFKLKPGGSVSNNATILMRQMGIIN
jgi:hypothetical protein